MPIPVQGSSPIRGSLCLPSLIQSAGRCNREGKPEKGKVLVFEPERGTPRYWSKQANWGEEAFSKFEDPMSPNAVRWYFQQLYDSEKKDGAAILPLLTQGAGKGNFDFRTAANAFRLIQEDGVDVVVPWDDEARRLVAELADCDKPLRFLRLLQNYTIRIPAREAKALNTRLVAAPLPGAGGRGLRRGHGAAAGVKEEEP